MQLYYQSYGSGHPLIILHGLLGSSDNWHTMGKQFGESFHTFALDARNHGRSPHSTEFNYRVLADDVRDFMEQQKLSSAFLLGHSMGGKTAIQFALTFSDRVDKLIVVDIAPQAYAANYSPDLLALASLDLTSFTNRKEIDALLIKNIPEFAIRQFLMKNLMRDKEGKFKWKMNLDIIRKNYAEINAGLETKEKFGKPTLFIKGGLSNYITQKDMPMIKKLFPKSTIATIAGAGHWVHAEAPGEFARIVIKFLQE